MLGTKAANVTLGVKSLEAARKFYEGVVGLKPETSTETGTATYQTGGAPLFVYESRFAGTNQATAVTWMVGKQLEEVVGGLKAKGVVFERYDLPQVTRQGDIHTGGGRKIAWFKDPDGNIHALTGE
jgi:catechol 2,3-dioxygenase-like lactoylglutathione lyase family enzyme